MDENRIKNAFFKVKQEMDELKSEIHTISNQIEEIKRTLIQTDTSDRQTDRQEIQTVPQEVGGLRYQNLPISIGNEGVQTDRQTDRQTDNKQQKFALSKKLISKEDSISKIEKVSEVLNSLDSLKKELRTQFKKLTSQEMSIFSTIYQLEESGFVVDYSLVSSKTNLSQSSIRDYVQNLIKKGIPIEKVKEGNKKITLFISPEFKKMASLHSIISLRNL